ncbi:MAG: hypothetical protein ACYDCQ_15510, partial [Dehalococcoidia bacterium]
MALPAHVERSIAVHAADVTRSAERETEHLLLFGMLLFAAGMEGVLFIMVRRLSLERYPHVIPTPQPVASVLGITERGLTWFVVAVGALVFCHIVACAFALRLRDPRYGLLAIGVSVVLIVTMVPMFPGGAHDVYHNVADARTLWVYHQDPISTPPNANPSDPIVSQLAYWPDLTSSYGPVWYIVAGAPALLAGDGLVANVVGQKLLVSLFLLGTLIIVYLMARRLRPGSATAAVVLFGWSPLVLWEIPGNAHNDIVMMFFAVATLYAVQRARWQLAFPLLALAVGVKFIMLLLGPLLLIWLLRRRPRVDLRELSFSIGGSAAILAIVYFPFVLAGHTIVNHGALQDRFISSPASLAIAFLMQYRSLNAAENSARALALTLFGVGYLWLLWRTHGSFEQLLNAAFWATFLTLTLPSWWFWPWYVVWLLPLAALLTGRRQATLALVFASSALLVYPIYYWRDVILNGPNWYANQFVIVGAVFGPVLLYLLGSSR